MAQLPVLKFKKVIRALERAGFQVIRFTGSHARLTHREKTALRLTIPKHNRDIPPTLLKEILKQADLSPEEFLTLL